MGGNSHKSNQELPPLPEVLESSEMRMIVAPVKGEFTVGEVAY